ncbi:MAG TPA: site-specific tyrosine recombinase [Acidimicrobiia bacterium]|nr:site-specific tyrosine recombinase [Acidimicrobiia bacterium]
MPAAQAALPDLVDEYLASLRAERGLAAATVTAYRRDLALYLQHLGESPPEPAAVSAFVASQHATGLAATTVARRLAAVRGFHRFLLAEGFAETDPTRLVDSPRRARALPKALTVQETFALLEAPDPTQVAGRRDRALLEFMYATGCRVTEAVTLDELDLDLVEGSALVTGKGNKQRLVPIGSAARRTLALWLPDRAALRTARSGRAVFLNLRGGRITRQGVWEVVRAAARRAGLPEGVASPHVLRHSAATHMVEGGADLRTVQELLGHASISTTQVYTRVSPRHLLEVYRTTHPRS